MFFDHGLQSLPPSPKEQNVKGGEGPSGKQAVGINNGTGKLC